MQAWMDRLNTRAKFALMALLLALPCAWLGLNLVHLESQVWQVARQENEGTPIAASLVQAQLALMRQRGQAGVLLARADSALPPFHAAQLALTQALDQAQRALQHPDIQASNRAALERQRRELEELAAAVVGRGLNAQQSLQRHQAQLRGLVELTGRVMHDTLLSYDPSVDSYHLIMASFDATPQLLDSLGRLRALTAFSLASGAAEAQRQPLLQLQGEIHERLGRLQLHYELASQANPGLANALPGEALAREVALLRQLSQQGGQEEGQPDAAAAAARFEAMSLPMQRLLEQSQRAQQALQALLAQRETDARLTLAGFAGGGLALLLLALLLAALALRWVQRRALAPLVALAELTERVATTQDYSLRAPVAQGDEVGRLADQVNEMLRRIQIWHEDLHQQLQQQRQAGQVLRQLAHRDHLTGLPNRLSFNVELERQLLQVQQGVQALGLLFIDLDHFKAINDQLGHEAGDEVLVEATRRLSSVLREQDTLFRLGGDEFALLVAPLHSEATLEQLAGRLIAAVGAPLLVRERRMPLGASIGGAIAPQQGQVAATLLRQADTAMYAAKAAGKNCYRIATP